MDRIFRFVAKEGFWWVAALIFAASFMLFGATISRAKSLSEYWKAFVEFGTLAAGVGTIALAYVAIKGLSDWKRDAFFNERLPAFRKMHTIGMEIVAGFYELKHNLESAQINCGQNELENIRSNHLNVQELIRAEKLPQYANNWIALKSTLNEHVSDDIKQIYVVFSKHVYELLRASDVWLQEISEDGKASTEQMTDCYEKLLDLDKEVKKNYQLLLTALRN